jgi:hypothetical protein
MVSIGIEDTVFRVLIEGAEICTHAGKADTYIAIFKAFPPTPENLAATDINVDRICRPFPEAQLSSMSLTAH